MATESKKLQTKLHPSGFPLVSGDVDYYDALRHDALIAHEQREVIRELSQAASHFLKLPTSKRNFLRLGEAISAAAPFLDY